MPQSRTPCSPRLNKKVSSTSSNDDAASDSQQSKPHPNPSAVAFTSITPSNHGIDKPQEMILSYSTTCSDAANNQGTDFIGQNDSLPELNQNQISLSSSDNCINDQDLVRKEGKDQPRLQWQIMSIEDKRWLEMIEKRGPEPETEDPEPSEPSPDITLPLLRFQKEWLTWGLNQEASEVRGGILADEMGMGKIIQAISLVVTARSRMSQSEASCSSSKDNNKCTLVICPLVGTIQWQKEIEKCTVNGSVKIFVFYGPKRRRGEVDFNTYDFVITTYSTVETDYRKLVMQPKEICEQCGRKFENTKALRAHQRKICLVDVLKEKEKGKITTPLIDPSADRDKSPLHSTRWERIILDEAHFIKERTSNMAQAVFQLESEYKWALTGTPLQNRVGELYSLIRFLQIFPYSYYFCKDCDCRTLDYISSAHCPACKHPNSRHFCWWNKYIYEPINCNFNKEEKQKALLLLREKVLKRVLLRRTKSEKAADFSYPPKFVTTRRETMDKEEQNFFQAMYSQTRFEFNAYVEAGTLMKNYANIFGMLTMLRLVINHPYLVMCPPQRESCGLCHSEADDPVTTACNHTFCKTCWACYSGRRVDFKYPICPTCFTQLSVSPHKRPRIRKTYTAERFKSPSTLNRLHLDDISKFQFQTSTKIEALKEEIRDMLEDDGSAKGVVFSHFESFLDLIGYSLTMSGVKWVQLDGSMNIEERNKAIMSFTDDADCKILLLSLKADGEALNLVVASHVFLMDPGWNPAAEKQAEDRLHRIGQRKPIRVTKFVIRNTIEERILDLQCKKEVVFEEIIGKSPEAMEKLTALDLMYVFSP